MSVTDDLLAQQRGATPPASTRATCPCRPAARSPWSPAWTPGSTRTALLGLAGGRRPRHPQRRRRGDRRRDPLAGDLASACWAPRRSSSSTTPTAGCSPSPTTSSSAAIQDEIGIKPEWAAEAFTDLDDDVRQSIARIKASPFIPRKDERARLRLRRRDGPPARGDMTGAERGDRP